MKIGTCDCSTSSLAAPLSCYPKKGLNHVASVHLNARTNDDCDANWAEECPIVHLVFETCPSDVKKGTDAVTLL